jgi:hypothetical protein
MDINKINESIRKFKNFSAGNTEPNKIYLFDNKTRYLNKAVYEQAVDIIYEAFDLGDDADKYEFGGAGLAFLNALDALDGKQDHVIDIEEVKSWITKLPNTGAAQDKVVQALKVAVHHINRNKEGQSDAARLGYYNGNNGHGEPYPSDFVSKRLQEYTRNANNINKIIVQLGGEPVEVDTRFDNIVLPVTPTIRENSKKKFMETGRPYEYIVPEEEIKAILEQFGSGNALYEDSKNRLLDLFGKRGQLDGFIEKREELMELLSWLRLKNKKM